MKGDGWLGYLDNIQKSFLPFQCPDEQSQSLLLSVQTERIDVPIDRIFTIWDD